MFDKARLNEGYVPKGNKPARLKQWPSKDICLGLI
jgi:hypothetical protein